jgi:tetratricopeptide (TPR) repeat protein
MGLKVFLSYAHDANTALVLRIRRDLETAGHTPWIDTAEIKTGDDWRRTILDGLADTDVTLAFLSRHAVREGGVCLDEIALALGMRHGNLATILVEPEPEVQPPVSVSHLQWLDMSGWATQDDAWYQDRLRTILDLLDDPETQRFRGEIEDLESRLQPITQAADIPPLIDGFVGREWVVAAVEAWRTSQPQRRIFRLTGGPGAGKSAFSAWLAHYQRANVVGLNLCKWNDEDRSDPRRVLRTLAFLLATRLPDYRRRLLDRFRRHDPKGEELDRKGAAAMFHWLLAEPLQQLIDGGRRRDRCVLLIDALDETLRNDTSELADLLAELAPKLPAWLALLLTSRPEFPIAASLSHIPPFRLDAEGSTENADDLRDYARQWLATPARTQAAADALIARVVGAAAGNFMYLRKLREAVEEFALDLDAPGRLPQGLSGLYRLWFRRQFPAAAAYRSEFAPILEVLVAASRPVPVELLRTMFGWDVPTEARLLQALGSLFEERPDGVTPFHASLRDWLTDRRQSGAEFVLDAARGSTRVTASMWGRFLATEAGSLPDAFTIAELPAQLERQDADALVTLLDGHGDFDPIAERAKGVVDALEARVAWRAVLAWLSALDRLAEAQGDAGLPWRFDALWRRAQALSTLGQMNRALGAHDQAISAAERAAAAEPDNVERRAELATAFTNRGVTKQSAPGHGPAAAIADYDRAIELRQALRDALGDDWPVPWRNDLAGAFMNRGAAKLAAPGHGPAAAIADFDRAIELRQALRDALGDDWPVPCRNDLADAFGNRGVAKLAAPGHGPAAAIADFDPAIALMQALGDDCPIQWRNDLAAAFEPRHCQGGRAGTRAGGGDRRLRPRHRTQSGAARRAGR